MPPIWQEPMKGWTQFNNLRESVRQLRGFSSITGLSEVQKCHLVSSIAYPLGGPCLFVTYDDIQADKFYNDFRFFFPKETVSFPQRELMLYNAAAHSQDLISQRLRVLEGLIRGEKLVIVASIDALMTPLMPVKVFKDSILELAEGQEHSLARLAERAVDLGYERVDTVEGKGQFSQRGSIFDIFPPSSEKPFRIDFFDDFIDSITSFDPLSQRSDSRIERAVISPAGELVLTSQQIRAGRDKIEQDLRDLLSKRKDTEKEDQYSDRPVGASIAELIDNLESGLVEASLYNYICYFYEQTATILDYLGQESIIVLDEPSRLRDHTNNSQQAFTDHFKDLFLRGQALKGQASLYASYSDFIARLETRKSLVLQALPKASLGINPSRIYQLTSRSIPSYDGKLKLLADDISYWKSKNYSLVLLSGSMQKGEGLKEALRDFDIEALLLSSNADIEIKPGQTIIMPGTLSKGFEYVEGRFALIADRDIFGVQKYRSKARKSKSKLDPFTDLKKGDLVVHENHGIGRYLGLEKMTVNGVERDYLHVQYAGTDRLYIPTDQMDIIQPYIGMDERRPKLSKLGGNQWQRAKAKARQSVKDLAFDLVKLYATRETTEGFQFSKDSQWQAQFEQSFPYEETPDQLQSIEEVKRDMESSRVMDRLLCGDVGYGKTEVALRAAFKAVMDAKQVAVLVPTTILAQQHYNTFVSRFGDFPFTIEVLSRFKSAKEQKDIIKRLKEGNVDVIVGTHRLLGKDVVFKDLGLLIIDEEQRFGVGHKETIKEIKKNIDVLTLTATPIPRTLHMSLVGIRDISLIETPPEDRYPVQTYVIEYDDAMIRDAIIREVHRGGQVYFVYNHVKTMERMAERLRALLPDIRIATAHGQMNESSLERIMLAFYEHEYDILLCTTIIENGLDIANVNTLIVYDADHLGLAQLYQLRGRVGRSNRIAYAYFTYKKDKILTEVSEKRLRAIKEFTEFGSGFKIAMRDLEIRGAGSIIGAQQSGQMAAVGYDLYCKLLDETIRTLKGQEQVKEEATLIDIRVDAYIDSSYISQQNHKIQMYKRIAAIEDLKYKYDVEEELEDRFGQIPKATQNLIDIAYIKALASRLGFSQISMHGRSVRLKLANDRRLDNRVLMVILNENRDIIRYTGSNPYLFTLMLKEENGDLALTKVKTLLERIAELT